jgi:hypothetical protein
MEIVLADLRQEVLEAWHRIAADKRCIFQTPGGLRPGITTYFTWTGRETCNFEQFNQAGRVKLNYIGVAHLLF